MRNSFPQIFKVLSRTPLSSHFLRLQLQGPLASWTCYPGAYVKLLLPGAKPNAEGQMKNKVRTYTIRSLDREREVLTIDFALHQPAGPATQWALNAQVGDSIELKGPGNLKFDPAGGDWYLFAADMAALPAALAVMESLERSSNTCRKRNCRDLTRTSVRTGKLVPGKKSTKKLKGRWCNWTMILKVMHHLSGLRNW